MSVLQLLKVLTFNLYGVFFLKYYLLENTSKYFFLFFTSAHQNHKKILKKFINLIFFKINIVFKNKSYHNPK